MTNRIDWRPSIAGAGGSSRRVNAILLCEDRGQSREPVRLIGRVGARLQGEVEIETSVWSYAELSTQETRAVVLRKAGDAGILAVATTGLQGLSPDVRRLLVEALLVRLGRPTSLLLFSGPRTDPAKSPSGIEDYLRQLAASVGAAFFVTTFHPEGASQGPDLAGSGRPSLPSGIQHWGINE